RGAGEIDPARGVEIRQVDDLTHRRHPVRLIADRGVPAGGVDDSRSSRDLVGAAVEQLLDRGDPGLAEAGVADRDRKSTRLNSSHVSISYAVFCLKKKKNI